MAVSIDIHVNDNSEIGIRSFLQNIEALQRALVETDVEIGTLQSSWERLGGMERQQSERTKAISTTITNAYNNQSQVRQKTGKDIIEVNRRVSESVSGLAEKIRYLNELNITPYGYERYAFRIATAFDNLGKKTALIFGGIAATAGYALVSIKQMAESGDPALLKFQDSLSRLDVAYNRLFLSIGRSDVVARGVSETGQLIHNLSEIISEGTATARGFWAVLSGDVEGARKAKAAIDEIRKSMEEIATARGTALGKSLLDSLDRSRFPDETLSRETDINKLNEMRAAEEKRTVELLKHYTSIEDQDRIIAEQRQKLLSIESRRIEILKQEENLRKALSDLDEKMAGKHFDEDKLDTLEDVTEEYKKQRAELEKLDKLNKLSSDEQERRLRKLTDLEKRKAELERESTQWLMENEQKLLEGKIRGWQMEAKAQEERNRREQDFIRAQQEFLRQQVESRMRLLGGEQAGQQAMQNIDPRLVRQSIAENRVEARRDRLEEKFSKERETFKDEWDGQDQRVDQRTGRVTTRDQAFNLLLRNQAKRRDLDLRQTRFNAFSDFNQGRVGAEEMRQGQVDAMGRVISNQEQQGKLSKETADAMRNLLTGAAQTAQNIDMLSAEVDAINAEAQRFRQMSTAQGARIERSANQRRGMGR